MRLAGYLRVRKNGTATFIKERPDLALHEVLIPIRIEIPDALFLPPAIPIVEVTLDESILPQIAAINEHVEQLQDAGVRVRLVEK